MIAQEIKLAGDKIAQDKNIAQERKISQEEIAQIQSTQETGQLKTLTLGEKESSGDEIAKSTHEKGQLKR